MKRLALLWLVLCATTLDNFNRPDGPVGGKWTPQGNVSIEGGRLKSLSGTTSVVYDSLLGANQTVSGVWSVIGGSENDLLLKCQANPGAHIEIRYDGNAHTLAVNTLAGSWIANATWSQSLVAGDTVTASCDSSGAVSVWRNSALVGAVALTSWPYRTSGGRVGVTLGTTPRLDVIATGTLQTPTTTSPLNDPINNLWLSWTWPSTDSLGYPETSLAYGRIYHRRDSVGSQWDSDRIGTGARWLSGGTKAFIGMPWAWFARKPTRFYVTSVDTSGNESQPSNEVIKTP